MSFLESNKLALAKLTSWYKNSVRPQNLPDALSDDPMKFGYNVKGAGIVCSTCGSTVTGKNLAFSGFSPTVQCYSCQHNV